MLPTIRARHPVAGGLSHDRARRHPAYVYTLPQHEAIRHAFRVASGLDSMVIGEPQILGQMKDAVRAAEEAGTLGTHCKDVPARFAVAKEVRTTTAIGANIVSMAAAACIWRSASSSGFPTSACCSSVLAR